MMWAGIFLSDKLFDGFYPTPIDKAAPVIYSVPAPSPNTIPNFPNWTPSIGPGEKEAFWCYVVQHRVAKAEGGWEPWESDTRPAHFRREADAVERCEARCREMASTFIEFRVAPKWLGYIPDADEQWIR